MILKKIFILLCTAFTIILTANAEDKILKKLIADGFPASYAVKLVSLQKKYPEWTFSPLLISKLDKQYTWEYILHQETDASPSRSLISGDKTFAAYFHPTDTQIYDASCRRASASAVAYFLDPRNFLNEQDIFQFENLSINSNIPLEAVATALKGSFMEKEILENGKSYAQYFCELGEKMQLNPLFLASRARQEQGLHGTPLISGKCGTLLLTYCKNKTRYENNAAILTPEKNYDEKNLQSFDGLYNFFNINATANGRFMIYLNGMEEARFGTPSMADEWGTPAWDTKWKSLYGGALKISLKYIANHQNSAYLQKWNIDPRSKADNGSSRNFWGQYMQNIGAALSESRNAYNALKKQNLLHLPFHFQIPVYENMPSTPCPDPANGKCFFYKSHNEQPAGDIVK